MRLLATTVTALLGATVPASATPRAPELLHPAAPAGELHHTVATRLPRAKISEFLVAPARKALAAKAYARAIPLYQALVVARGPASPEAKQLAILWTDAGQPERAIEAWKAYRDATPSDAERRAALGAIERLVDAMDPLADKLALTPLVREARRAFKLGRAAFARQRYGDALVYFHIGHALAPELPGFLRELGATYDKLGAATQRRELYRRYLVQRPFGANADAVRAELAKDKDVLGTLQISSSLPCTELWINRQRVTGKLPAAGIVVAPGTYKGLCFNPRYEMALFEYATVAPGQPAVMTFAWAIIENKLEQPYGRIALENPKAPGMMVDLGITATEIGVAAPSDGRKLQMILKDDTGVRTERRLVEIRPGQRLQVRW